MDTIFSSIKDMLHEIEMYHDVFTVEHEIRTGKLMSLLAQTQSLETTRCQSLEEVGAIHDVGKIAIPAKILEKPLKLSKYEREIIELHPQIGYNIVKKIKHPFCELAATVILTHHEAYDGSGYPKGLKRDEIPLEGRICRICDVYDALRSYRPYRIEHATHESVVRIMTDKNVENMYNTFDPELLEAFLTIDREQCEAIYAS